MTNLATWLASNIRNQWIEEPGLELYVRKGLRIAPSKDNIALLSTRCRGLLKTLDIANMNANPTGKGAWKALVAKLPDLARQHNREAIFVENVLDPRFQSWFERSGWTKDTRYGVPCYWLFL